MKTMKAVLRALLVLFAATAVVTGLLLIITPGSVPGITGNDTPVRSFFVPGIMLALLVGGANMYAAIMNIKRRPHRYDWAITGGAAIAFWIVTQMLLIGTVNWLQLLYLTTGVLVIFIAFQLKGKWIV